MNTNIHQKPDFVADAMHAWKTCLPNELSNLFYVKVADGLKRIKAFTLDLDEGDKIILKDKIEVAEVHAVKIGMGCVEDQFSPIFCIITQADQQVFSYYYYKMQFPLESNAKIIISEGIADLFAQKWLELNDNEVKLAFSGATVSEIKNIADLATGSTQVQELRVNFYTFEKDDAVKIVSHLKDHLNTPNYGLKLLLGAGLSIRMTHPFNFRPIIHIYGSQGREATQNTFFERGKPCPPFCNTAGF